MTLFRNVLFALSALMLAPTAARAADDEMCLAWVHVFHDSEIDHDQDTVSVSFETVCLERGAALEDLTPPKDGKPHHGAPPEWSLDQECRVLLGEIEEMRRALRAAERALPGAREALAAAETAASAEAAAYRAARAEWLRAVGELRRAKEAYARLHPVTRETHRDPDGHLMEVIEVDYDTSTPEGRAVADAQARVFAAEAVMDAKWEAWGGLGGSAEEARNAQFRVDQYTTVIDESPGQIAAAEAFAREFGCQ